MNTEEIVQKIAQAIYCAERIRHHHPDIQDAARISETLQEVWKLIDPESAPE